MTEQTWSDEWKETRDDDGENVPHRGRGWTGDDFSDDDSMISTDSGDGSSSLSSEEDEDSDDEHMRGCCGTYTPSPCCEATAYNLRHGCRKVKKRAVKFAYSTARVITCGTDRARINADSIMSKTVKSKTVGELRIMLMLNAANHVMAGAIENIEFYKVYIV